MPRQKHFTHLLNNGDKLDVWYQKYVKENTPPKETKETINNPTNLSSDFTPAKQTQSLKRGNKAIMLGAVRTCPNCNTPLPKSVALTSSANVFINGKPALQAGDSFSSCVCPGCVVRK